MIWMERKGPTGNPANKLHRTKLQIHGFPYPEKIVDGYAHFSDDESYDGWLFYDTDGNDYYQEDFGAELVYDPDDE